VKLCIPIEVRPEGGMYTFVGYLKAWLTRRGVPFAESIEDDYDLLFVNSWVTPYAVVRRVKRERPTLRVAHRVDGAAVDYGSNPEADRIQARVNLLADVTIFQSQYSRYSTREKYKVVVEDGPVIFNPVDLDLFTPEGPPYPLPHTSGVRIGAASWSVNRGKGTWQIDALAEQHPDMTFVLAGRFDAVATRDNVVRLGHLPRADMARFLRSCDLFLNLSENDPCPNVVIEALASGLPVLYRPSGGVPELVGDAGVSWDAERQARSFRACVSHVLDERLKLSQAARSRAEGQFAFDVVFPRYLEAMQRATRRPLPSAAHTLKLAAAGYPVLPRARRPAELVRAIRRRGPELWRRLAQHGARDGVRIGWVTYDSFPRRKSRFSQLDSFTGMRVGNVARWLNAHRPGLANELYDPERRYDVVVFQKMMDERCQAEADKIHAYGGKVVFDVNVNYYEVWGDYVIEGTKPTETQQRDAHRMTAVADWAVADSTYLLSVVRTINERASWIPDNVNLDVYRGPASYEARRSLRLVWSGIAKKAAHLLLIADVLASMSDLELVLVADEPPACLAQLQRAVPCRFVRFSDRKYARVLAGSDVIISPKQLVNAYEMGHTEYKITLGMAVGLPAVASAQQSYVEALADGGGIIAREAHEWHAALERLRDPVLRAEMGRRARQTVVDRYSTGAVAAVYGDLLTQLAAGEKPSASPQHVERAG
jgi:glycosyltransferase involved in cell wall biosynthesis